MTCRAASERQFTTHDGLNLFYRAWLPDRPTDRAVILFHRGHEHSGRWQEVVDRLGLADCAIFAWDARGHGESPGPRGYAEHFGVFVRDADCFVKHVAAQYHIPFENIVVVGHSVGAVIVATWVHDYALPIRGMVLATPAFRVKLYVPLAIPALRMLHKLRGRGEIKSYVKSRMLTHDKVEAAKYEIDPLIERAIADNILIDLCDTSQRVVADAGAIVTPTLLFAAGNDWVVRFGPQRDFMDRLSSTTKELHLLPGFYHAVFHEQQRHLTIDATSRFIQQLFANPPQPVDLRRADRHGVTYQEHRELKQSLPWYSPRRWSFALQRLLMGTIGPLSTGVKLGWQTGFDSGRTLDYVYDNQARGCTFVGRMIDRLYLNAIGWRGIRERKRNLESLLTHAIDATLAAGRRAHVVDIATGAGRYVIDTLANYRATNVTACLRDFVLANIEAGRRLAESKQLDHVTFEQGDAFDAESLAKLEPRPTIAIVSGLYELFPDNSRVQQSLAGVHQALEDDGLLIYTCQPWHPQLEMIARVLTSHRDGQPWIMRRRTQAEMDQLVAAAGFEKIEMRIDRWGIFTVSLARKVSQAKC